MATCGCGGAPLLPKKIRRDLLEQLTTQTKLKAPEVKALYARFRRLAPNGFLLPDQFKQTMGVIGLTDDPFLPDRMFQVFDTDNDGKLDFVEFAQSLAVMIRGTEDEKLSLSYQMAAGRNRGIELEDFRKLIRACDTMMSSLVAQPRRDLLDEDIERLFHDLSSDDCGSMSEGERMITMEAYRTAAQSNDEFLSCLGLEVGLPVARSKSHEAPRKPSNGTTSPRSTTNDHTPPATEGPVPAIPRVPPGNIVVTAAQFKDLRDRLSHLRQAVVQAHVGRSNGQGAVPPQFCADHDSAHESGRASASASSTASPRNVEEEEHDPNERWWTPLRKRKEAEVTWDISPDAAPLAGLDQVDAEFDRVLRWCNEVDIASRFGGPSSVVVSATGGISVETPFSVPRPLNARVASSGPHPSAPSAGSAASETAASTNGARPHLSRFADRSYSGVTVLSSGNPATTLGPQASMIGKSRSQAVQKSGSSSRRRKRHRLLGPKKGLAVHFGHENWNMVLSMMIGIRMSVGRSKHEIARELQPVDFLMKEKFSILPRLANVFDSAVSKRVTMTRFIDYAPMVFQRIRSSFGIQHDEYLRSIGPEQLLGNLVLGNLASLSELSSEGKSGAFFYYTADGKYMLKTVAPKEHALLKRMLQRYYDHITQQPGTLIVRFLGLHCLRVRKAGRVTGSSASKLYFVVMGNMFNTPFEIHRRYDLKGSWVGRLTPANDYDPTVALKDVDFTKANESIRVGKERRTKLLAQIERDAKFLSENNIIDYSLLLGVHDIGSNGSHACAGDEDVPSAVRPETGPQSSLRQATEHSTSDLPGVACSPPAGTAKGDSACASEVPMHQREMGGMLSSDKRSLYFVGIIDILTPYDTFKRLECGWKALRHDWRGVSCCPPGYYAERFTGFMGAAIV